MHNMLGNRNKYKTRNTDNSISLKPNPRNMGLCDAGDTCISEQNVSPKKSEHKPEASNGDCIYIDIGTANNRKKWDLTVAKLHWIIAVDEITGQKT